MSIHYSRVEIKGSEIEIAEVVVSARCVIQGMYA